MMFDYSKHTSHVLKIPYSDILIYIASQIPIELAAGTQHQILSTNGPTYWSYCCIFSPLHKSSIIQPWCWCAETNCLRAQSGVYMPPPGLSQLLLHCAGLCCVVGTHAQTQWPATQRGWVIMCWVSFGCLWNTTFMRLQSLYFHTTIDSDCT